MYREDTHRGKGDVKTGRESHKLLSETRTGMKWILPSVSGVSTVLLSSRFWTSGLQNE